MLALLLNKWTWIALAFVALAIYAGAQRLSVGDLTVQNAALTTEVTDLKGKVEAEKTKVKLQDSAIDALQRSMTEQRQNAESERLVIERIDKAPASDDGPVAPVLKRTIEDLDGVLGKGPR